MSFYNTGNPVPSIDPRDLDDNAKHIDSIVNSTEFTFFDRLGTERLTMAGVEAEASSASTLRGDLAADDGSTLVYDKQSEGITYKRQIKGKLDALASVKDYGVSVGSGVTSDHLAAIAMGAALGYIHFSRGNYVIDTCTLDYPVSFDKKASITANPGQVVTIRAPITSPKQYILKGVGTYVLTQNNSAAGEDVREVHASWFGAFPNLGDLSDQGPAINRAFAAMGNGRESIVHFDIGGYVINSTVTITRAGWVKGAGTRRTVFKSSLDGFPFFVDTSAGIAKITDCNFETIGGLATRTSPFIEFSFNESELYNIRMGQTNKGIVTSGNGVRISSVTAAYGANKGAGSDLIQIKGGSGVLVENIQLSTSSAFGPDSVVRVGGTGHLGVGHVDIRKIYHTTPSISVSVEAFDLNVSGVFIDSVQYNGFAGTPPAQMIKLETSGTASLDNVNIDKIQGSTRSIAMVSCLQNSSGFTRRISIDGVQDRRSDGNGIELVRTNGILENVDIGSGVQLKTRDNPVYRSGSLGEVRISDGVEKDSSPVLGKFANIPDDGVYVFNLGKSVFVAGVRVWCATGATFNWGDYIARVASSPAVFAIQQSANMATALTALTGTTGTDGKITVGITEGILYLENRSGATINIAMSVTGA